MEHTIINYPDFIDGTMDKYLIDLLKKEQILGFGLTYVAKDGRTRNLTAGEPFLILGLLENLKYDVITRNIKRTIIEKENKNNG